MTSKRPPKAPPEATELYEERAELERTVLAILLTAQKELPKLAKADHNQYENFSFVKIDDYYEKIAPILLDHGFFWNLTCDDVQVLFDNIMLWKIRVRFQLEADESVRNNVYMGETVIPVVHHYDGPQTTGIVFSYADKIFLRTMFKIVTGEKDADSSAKRPYQPLPVPSIDLETVQPAFREIPEEEPVGILSLEDHLSRCRTKEDLLQFGADRNQEIIELRKTDPARYRRLILLKDELFPEATKGEK